MRRALALLLLAAPTLLAALPGLAEPLTELDATAVEGPFWMAYRVHVAVSGTTARAEVQPSYEAARALGDSLFLVRATDGATLAFAGRSQTIDNVEAHAEAAPAPAVAPSSVFAFSGGAQPIVVEASGEDALAPGDYWFVAVNMNPAVRVAQLRLHGSAGVALVAKAQGSEGLFAREVDFAGGVNVQARAGVAGVAPVAQVGRIVDGHVAFTAQHTLFGWLESRFAAPQDVRYTAPGSPEVAGYPVYAIAGPAGAYDFRAVDWQAATTGQAAYLLVNVADVALP